MTDEQIRATDNFKRLDFFSYDWQIRNEDFETRDEMLEYAEKMQKIILNLIEKQQKEIEELKYKYEKAMETNECLYQFDNKTSIDKFYISKDKIKDILNYLNDTELNNYEIVMAFKKMMKELLDDGDHIPRID